MKCKTIVMQGRRMAVAVCGLLVGGAMMQSCEDDVLTGQPEWLGNSIYERLQEDGNYTTVIRLIDDLGESEMLAHTGSRTLFVADDQAYDAWFASNDWGVHRYEDLSMAQKKLLLNNAMIRNAYLLELLANVKGTPPKEGMCMRRETATSIYDSVYIMPVSKMPDTEAWAPLKAKGKSVPMLMDNYAAPMIHFLPAYMTYNKITDEDLSVLTNHQATSTSEAWINGKKVIERDITCKNGYIQKVDGVVESSPNMAQIIREHPSTMSQWSALLDKFSAPYYSRTLSDEYQRVYNTEDSVFVLRYYSSCAAPDGNSNTIDPFGNSVDTYLSFDPGWNQYMYVNTMGYDLHYDAAAMIVPSNKALEDWWNGEGSELQDEYGTLEGIPMKTLSKLINVNMLPTFSEAVPSKFDHVLNDAKEPLGIKAEDVDSCFMGCNGVVYLTNKVFTPAEYASVAYPALAHQSTMNILYWAVETQYKQGNYDFGMCPKKQTVLPYLLSMSSNYAFLMPTNDAMSLFIDPASYGYGENNGGLIAFRYDDTKRYGGTKVQAVRYHQTLDEEGNIVQGEMAEEEVARNVMDLLLMDMLNQIIIVLPEEGTTLEDYVAQGYSYFKSKGGTLVKVVREGDGLAVAGGWQMEHGKTIPVTKSYKKKNGESYQLEEHVPLGAEKSLYMTLKEHNEYSAFLKLIENDYSGLTVTKLSNTYNAGTPSVSKNFKLFDNYNYTVYVPTNASIEALQDQNLLPKWNELDIERNGVEVLDSICEAEHWYPASATEAEKEAVQNKVKAAVSGIIENFVRYHVQDHSVAIGMVPEAGFKGNEYESMMRNPATGRFYKLTVNCNNNSMTVTDVKGNTRSVVTNDNLYNRIIREYWFEGDYSPDDSKFQTLFMTSDAVVHLINAPLFCSDMKPWREVVKEALNN